MSVSPLARNLIFTQAEYDARIAAARREMSKQGVDLLVVHSAQNIFYLTGHYTFSIGNYQCALIPRSGDPVLVVRDLESGNARVSSWLNEDQLVCWEDTDDPVAMTVKTIQEQGFGSKTVGLEENSFYLSSRNATRIRRELPDATVVDAGGLVELGRRVKSPQEIAYIRRACQSTAKGMAAAAEEIRPGRTENDVAAAIFSAMIRDGSEFLTNDPIVTSGPRSGVPHTTFLRRELQQGDAVLLEFGAAYNRYIGPQMRWVSIGEPTRTQRQWSDLCLEALANAIAAVKPGVTTGDVDDACRTTFERAGLYEYYKKRTGYSVGIGFAPGWVEGTVFSVQQYGDVVLEPGMTFHMPPAMRMPGEFAVGFSETVAVSETGCEVLSTFPREVVVT